MTLSEHSEFVILQSAFSRISNLLDTLKLRNRQPAAPTKRQRSRFPASVPPTFKKAGCPSRILPLKFFICGF